MGWLSRKGKVPKSGKVEKVSTTQPASKDEKSEIPTPLVSRTPITVAPPRLPPSQEGSFQIEPFSLSSPAFGSFLGEGSQSYRNPFLENKRSRKIVLECLVPCALYPVQSFGLEEQPNDVSQYVYDLLVYIALIVGRVSSAHQDLQGVEDVNAAIARGTEIICDSSFGFLVPNSFRSSPTEELSLTVSEKFQIYRQCKQRGTTGIERFRHQGLNPPVQLERALATVSSLYTTCGAKLLQEYDGYLVITELVHHLATLKRLIIDDYPFDARDTVVWSIRVGSTKTRLDFFSNEKTQKNSKEKRFPLHQLVKWSNDPSEPVSCWVPIKIKLEYRQRGTFHRFHTLARYEGKLPVLNVTEGRNDDGPISTLLALRISAFAFSSKLKDQAQPAPLDEVRDTDCILVQGFLDPPLEPGVGELLRVTETATDDELPANLVDGKQELDSEKDLSAASPPTKSRWSIGGRSPKAASSQQAAMPSSTTKHKRSTSAVASDKKRKPSTSRWLYRFSGSGETLVDVSSMLFAQRKELREQAIDAEKGSFPSIQKFQASSECLSTPLIYLDGQENNPKLLYIMLLKVMLKEENPMMFVAERQAIARNLDGFSLELDISALAGAPPAPRKFGQEDGDWARSARATGSNEEYAFGPVNQHQALMLLSEFAACHGISRELHECAVFAMVAQSCEHAIAAAIPDSTREPHLSSLLSMLQDQAEKILGLLDARSAQHDAFALGLVGSACGYLDAELEQVIAKQRHELCTGLHFEDGTYGSAIRALHSVALLGARLPDGARQGSLVQRADHLLVRLAGRMVGELDGLYRAMKVKAIRDIGYDPAEAPRVSPNSVESRLSHGVPGTDAAFKCERFSVDLPLPQARTSARESSAVNGSTASLAALVEAANPRSLAAAALQKGMRGSLVWGFRLKESSMQGLVEIEGIAPASAAAMAVAMAPIQSDLSGSGNSPYLRQPKQGDILLAVGQENVAGWSLDRVQEHIQRQVELAIDRPEVDIPGAAPQVLEFTFQSPLSTTDRVVLPPPPSMMSGVPSPAKGKKTAHSGGVGDGWLRVQVHQVRGVLARVSTQRAMSHATLYKVKVRAGESVAEPKTRRVLGKELAVVPQTGREGGVLVEFEQDGEELEFKVEVMNALKDHVVLELYSGHKPFLGKRQWHLEGEFKFELYRLMPSDLSSFEDTRWIPETDSARWTEVRATFTYDAISVPLQGGVGNPASDSNENPEHPKGRFHFTSPRKLFSGSKRTRDDPGKGTATQKQGDDEGHVDQRRPSRIHPVSITKATTAKQTLGLAELIKDYLSKELSLFLPTLLLVFPWEENAEAWATVSNMFQNMSHLQYPETLHVYTLSSAIVTQLFTRLLADTTLVLQANPPRFDSLNESIFPLHQSLLDMLQSCSTKHSSDWPILSTSLEESLAESITNLFNPYVTSWIEATWRSVRDTFVLRIVDSIDQFAHGQQGTSTSSVNSLPPGHQLNQQLLAKFGRGQRANDLKWILQETSRVFFSLRFEHGPVTLRRYGKRLVRDPINLFVAKVEEYLLQSLYDRKFVLHAEWSKSLELQALGASPSNSGNRSRKRWRPKFGRGKGPSGDSSRKSHPSAKSGGAGMSDSSPDTPALLTSTMACFFNDLVTLDDSVASLFTHFQRDCLSATSLRRAPFAEPANLLLSMHRFTVHLERVEGLDQSDPLFITAKVAHTRDELTAGYFRKLHTRAFRQDTMLDESLLFDISAPDPLLRLELVRVVNIRSPAKYSTQVVGFLEIPLSGFPVSDADDLDDHWWAFRPLLEDVGEGAGPLVQVGVDPSLESPLSLPPTDALPLPEPWGMPPAEQARAPEKENQRAEESSANSPVAEKPAADKPAKRRRGFHLPKFHRKSILTPRGTYSRRFLRKPDPVGAPPEGAGQSPRHATQIAETLRRGSAPAAYDSCRVLLSIQHTRVALRENTEDILYEAINRVCDVFSSSLCEALAPLVRAACGMSPADASGAAGTPSHNLSLARARLLDALDQQLSKFHKCLNLVAGQHPCFKRVLLHTFRGISTSILKIMLPDINVDRLVGLETEVNRVVVQPVRKSAAGGPRRILRHTSSKILVDHEKTLKRHNTDEGSGLGRSSGQQRHWKTLMSPRKRKESKLQEQSIMSLDTKSHQRTTEGMPLSFEYVEDIAHLVDRLRDYFSANGSGLTDTVLQCDPYGPDQLRIVLRNVQDDMTPIEERASTISEMLRQLGGNFAGVSDADTRASMVMLFREWLCCKCIESTTLPRAPSSVRSAGEMHFHGEDRKRRTSFRGNRSRTLQLGSISSAARAFDCAREDLLSQMSFAELLNGSALEDIEEEGDVHACLIQDWFVTLLDL